MNAQAQSDILSVSQLNRLAKQLLEDCFANVTVVGELSNFARPSSGHWYFTLKDERAQIRCAMFKNRNFAVRFAPEAGQQVQVRGKVSLYENRGDYQLIVDSMQPAGAGALALAFEQLKQELQAAGWFERKRPLPRRISHVAVITSPTGAALRDVLSVFARRWPAMRITLIPAQVQGEAAAPQLVRAIALANAMAERPDVLLLTRGGGSLEDLWSFNERSVAEAVFHSELPVVCAVGHEVDFSIADFVADLRAPTPSAAAELLSPDREEMLDTLAGLEQALHQSIQRTLATQSERLRNLQRRLRHPGRHLQEQAQRLDERELHLRRLMRSDLARRNQHLDTLRRQLATLNPARALDRQRQTLAELEKRLLATTRRVLRERGQALDSQTNLLNSMNPGQVLQRGYAIVFDADGRALRDSTGLDIGATVQARLARGGFSATVTTVDEERDQ